MSDLAALYRAQENLRMVGSFPTWYDHLASIEASMTHESRVYDVRTAAGWELDEGGWYVPCPETNEMITEWDWLGFGLGYPEDAK